jgi:hypothetical protein
VVKNWFQAFAFKWVNLRRYNAPIYNTSTEEVTAHGVESRENLVGLCRLNQVDP